MLRAELDGLGRGAYAKARFSRFTVRLHRRPHLQPLQLKPFESFQSESATVSWPAPRVGGYIVGRPNLQFGYETHKSGS
jgi:hypothetical protein